jgi:hypothetical protein
MADKTFHDLFGHLRHPAVDARYHGFVAGVIKHAFPLLWSIRLSFVFNV